VGGDFDDKNQILFVGLLAGALAGIVATLLLAPQSGAETRTQIREKGVELKEKAETT
jgi:gas vesicle protein